MLSKTHWILGFLLVFAVACSVTAKPKETINPDEVAEDPDYIVQGEYVGEGELPDGSNGKIGAQVIAQGDGKFRVVIYRGGLPGDGWKRKDQRYFLDGKREDDATKLESEELLGNIANKEMTLTDKDGKTKAKLARTERKSPTLGEKPPKGATVLFDGKDHRFDHGHVTEWGTILSGITTKPTFDGQYRIHMELCLSWMPHGRGQGRSNSGLYIHDCYECQVLDSFGLEGKNNECGGFYKVREPNVNMCLPPMQWQTYDVYFTAPQYDGDKKVKNARVTVVHNGVAIHDDLELPHGTPGRKREGPGPRPFHLQGHGNKVQYRNVWVAPEK